MMVYIVPVNVKKNIKLPPFGIIINVIFLLFGLWGYWHCDHSWPIVPASGESEDDCGEVDGM
jgi:hypothetical protein